MTSDTVAETRRWRVPCRRHHVRCWPRSSTTPGFSPGEARRWRRPSLASSPTARAPTGGCWPALSVRRARLEELTPLMDGGRSRTDAHPDRRPRRRRGRPAGIRRRHRARRRGHGGLQRAAPGRRSHRCLRGQASRRRVIHPRSSTSPSTISPTSRPDPHCLFRDSAPRRPRRDPIFDAAAVAEAGHLIDETRRAGLKIRCGGLDASAVPTVDAVAAAISAGLVTDLPLKATQGLHHPIRHHDATLGATVHGFLNLFAAAVLARAHHLDDGDHPRHHRRGGSDGVPPDRFRPSGGGISRPTSQAWSRVEFTP